MGNILGRAIAGAAIGMVAGKIVDIASDKLVKVTNRAVTKIKNSEKYQEIKKDRELRKDGVQTVKYTEI